MTRREEVSRERLLEILNQELAKYPECHEIGVGYIDALQPDEDGCNWEVSTLRLRASGLSEASLAVVNQVILEMKHRFNLNPDE